MDLPTAAIEGDVVEEVLLGAAVLLVEAVEVGAQFLADGVALAELRLVDGGHLGEDVLVVGLVALGDLADVLDDGLLAVVVDLALADVIHHAGNEADDELEVGLVLNVADGGRIFEGLIKGAAAIFFSRTSRHVTRRDLGWDGLIDDTIAMATSSGCGSGRSITFYNI